MRWFSLQVEDVFGKMQMADVENRNNGRPWEGAKNNFKLDFWMQQSTDVITLNQ